MTRPTDQLDVDRPEVDEPTRFNWELLGVILGCAAFWATIIWVIFG